MILHGVAVFMAAILLDVVWARWTLSMTAHRAERAAGWAALIVLIGVFNVESYVTSPWYSLPSACGAAIGTYVTVRRARSKAARA